MDGAYAASPDEVLRYFGGVSEKNGLTTAQVEEAQKKYGRNGE